MKGFGDCTYAFECFLEVLYHLLEIKIIVLANLNLFVHAFL